MEDLEQAPAALEAEPASPEEPLQAVSTEELLEGVLLEEPPDQPTDSARTELKAVLEAIIYITEDPVAPAQIAAAVNRPVELVQALLEELSAEYERPEHGLTIRVVAGGYKMGTKAEHHDSVRAFVKSLKPALKLSLAALETLAVIAYKQPITSPEVMEIRGVQGTGVLKTLLDRKLIAASGRKNVIGRPVLYKTTKEFLVQFGLKEIAELPSLKEFEEIRRMALPDGGAEVADAPASDRGAAAGTDRPPSQTSEGAEPGQAPEEQADAPESAPVEVSQPIIDSVQPSDPEQPAESDAPQGAGSVVNPS
ncbi:MAG: SMC-Scp complex subunit ScpB [Bryobacteraceae bacterium]